MTGKKENFFAPLLFFTTVSNSINYRLTRKKKRNSIVFIVFFLKSHWPWKLILLLNSNKKKLLFKGKAEEVILRKRLFNCEKEKETLNEKCVSYRKDLDVLEEQLR